MALLSHLAAIDKNTRVIGPPHEFHKISKGNYSHFTGGKLWHKAHFHWKTNLILLQLEKFSALFLNLEFYSKTVCLSFALLLVLRNSAYRPTCGFCQLDKTSFSCQSQEIVYFERKSQSWQVEFQSSDTILPWVSTKNFIFSFF